MKYPNLPINNFDDVRPIFIGGCPRSGTTMLGSILGSASGCIVTPESHFKQTIPAALNVAWNRGIGRDDFYSALNRNFRFKIWGISIPEENQPGLLKPIDYRRAILSLVNAYAGAENKKNWRYWIDHTPQNIQDPLMLLTIFPNAKFIHLVRDPRAVAASILPLDWGPDTAEEAAFFWARKLSYGLVSENVYPDKFFRVYYEDILTSPGLTVKKVCEYCGIKYDESILSGNGFKIPDYTKKQHMLVGSNPDPHRLNAWQKSLDIWQIADIEKTIGDLMELMNYRKFLTGKLPKRPMMKRFAKRFRPVISYLKKKRFHYRKNFYA